jgi:hypothetical protein
VDNWEFTLTVQSRQGIRLSAKDRRLLLGRSLRLLGYRHALGQRILREDVTRIALFADDGETELVQCTQLVPGAGESLSPGP